PSLICLEDNRLLLLYACVPSHKTDEQGEAPSEPKQTIQIAMRTSADNGSTWSAERTIAELPASASSATSAEGPVQRQSQLPLLTTALAGDERIDICSTLPEQASLWAWSTDHGDTETGPQPSASA